MDFHVHLIKRVPDNFGTGRQVYSDLKYVVSCKPHQVSGVAENAEGKGFTVADIHRADGLCSYRQCTTDEEG